MFLSLIFLCIPLLIFTATAAEFRTHYCELNTTSHTHFYSNLIQVLDSLALDFTTISDKKFLSNSTGRIPPDIAYGLNLCRADVLPSNCLNCLLNAHEDINKTCPFSTAAVSWSDNCMLRYANYSMVSVMNSAIYIPQCNKVNISDMVSEQNRFWKVVTKFMSQLANRASSEQKEMFSYDELSYNNEKIYGYVQCTPDLSDSDCYKCLQLSTDRLWWYCYGRKGARVLAASCNLRFEIYEFLQFAAVSSDKPVDKGEIITEQSLQFELGTIQEATNNFSIENKVGEGGFGIVYKGILANGQEIAVKRLTKGFGQGLLEIKNEVVLLAKLHHRNLVRLLGFCLDAKEKILIYEYVANNTPTRDTKLDSSTRYRIIGGIARGMLYLHEDSRLRIIHRDLKTSNILLDDEMNPKISDFGMARIICGNKTQEMTNRIVGTFGYMSPEYAMHGHFSVKSDVFSFGVLVLEIISGKRNKRFAQSDYADLVCYAWSK